MTAFHCANRAAGISTLYPDLRVRTEPAGPFFAGIFGVAGAHEKFHARLLFDEAEDLRCQMSERGLNQSMRPHCEKICASKERDS